MSTTTITDKFVRSDDFASRIDSVCLPDEAWAVFAQLEQPTSAEELSRELEQPVDAVLESIQALLEHNLVRKKLRNWREFLAEKKGGSPTPTDSAPVADARVAGRPGAALAGWPKPTAPRIETEATPAIDAPDAAAPAAMSAPVAPLADLAPSPALAVPPTEVTPPVFNYAAESTPSLSSPGSSPADKPAEPPPLFSDFSLPGTRTPTVEPVAASPVAPAPAEAPVPAPVSPRAGSVPTPAAVTTAPRTNPENVLPVSFTIANEKARIERRAATAMTISFSIGAAVTTAPTAWRLNTLLKAIGQKAGGGLPGQLLVYRVFIHVPADMMHAAGIQSLSLVDDSVMIRDRGFYDALCQAAHAVAGVDLRAVKA